MCDSETSSTNWAPQACTLPTSERPLREAEFDDLFATSLRHIQRLEPTKLRLSLTDAPGLEKQARDLTARETDCCSFFTFAIDRADHELELEITVPAAHIAVLDALAARAAERIVVRT